MTPAFPVLNRAQWSSLQLSRVLLSLLIQHLDGGDGPLVFGIDETLERRRGSRIRAKGIYRDAVRSSRSHFVKTSGLRWISLMLLTNIPWAHRTWALPVLTALAPSERYCHQLGRTHKRLTDWARQMIVQVRRWIPNRPVVVVADSSYAALDLFHFCQSMTRPVTFITDCVWTLHSTNPLHLESPDRWGVDDSRANVCPHSPIFSNVPTRAGPRCLWTGMTAPLAWCRWSLRRRSGITPARPPCPFAGFSFETSSTSSSPRCCCTRSGNRPDPDHRVVRSALADRGDVSGGPCPSGSGDSTTVVGSRHISDHSFTVGTVLLDNSRSPSVGRSSADDSTISGMVCQVSAYFHRFDRSGATSPLV